MPVIRKEKGLPVLLSLILFFFMLVFSGSPAGSMGIIPTGGNPNIGISALELTDTISRPLPPLNSILLDETWQTLLPVGKGVPLTRWEEIEPGKIRLTLESNIVWADESSRIISSQDIVTCMDDRTSERWDAKWALRGIEEFVPFDERTIDLILKPGVDPDQVRRALRTPALRIDLMSDSGTRDGTGPFLPRNPSPDRNLLQCRLMHHAGRAWLDEVNIVTYPSADDSVLDFGRGNLDALMITSNERGRYNGSSRAEPGRIETIGQALMLLVFNPVKFPDPNERKALALAVDRTSLAQVVLGEGAVVACDFHGTPSEDENRTDALEEARRLYVSVGNPRESLKLLVPDDPAARAAAGRLRANWESFGVPVELIQSTGPLSLSMEADIILVSLRIPNNGEGVLPQCLALYDRSGWWEIAALSLPLEGALLLRSVRALEPSADSDALGSAVMSAGMMLPLARYDILFAPGPDISLAPERVYPGTVFWRAFMGVIPEPVNIPDENKPDDGQDE